MKKLFIILTALVFVASAALAGQKDYGSVEVKEVTSIYDGDTFRVNIKDYPALIGERIAIRVGGIDTPEMRGKCIQEKELARKAKQLTVGLLREATKIELRHMKRGKYFRIVADVYIDGKNLADSLFEAGLGVRYEGKTKNKDWCK